MDQSDDQFEAKVLAMRLLRAQKNDRRRTLRPGTPEMHQNARERLLSDLRPANCTNFEARALRKNEPVDPTPPLAFELEGNDNPAHLLEPFDPLAPPLPPPDLAERQEFWRRAFKRDTLSLQELAPFRVRIAWRFIRELLRVFDVHTHEPLSDLAPSLTVEDPWKLPRPYESARTPRGLVQAAHLVEILREASNIPRENTATGYTGISLLPPEVPARFLNEQTGQAREDYDPSNPFHDPTLHCYCAALAEVAAYLNFEAGSRSDPNQGAFGLYGMTNPRLVRLVFPARGQIIAWEKLLAEETLQCIVKKGMLLTREWLLETHGLQKSETKAITEIAREIGHEVAQGDLEHDRALMVLRLEDVGARAREAGNIREELNSLKQAAILKGFARSEPEDILADFTRVVERIATEADRQEIEGSATVKEIELDEPAKTIEPAE